jgi:hypothetical protein
MLNVSVSLRVNLYKMCSRSSTLLSGILTFRNSGDSDEKVEALLASAALVT